MDFVVIEIPIAFLLIIAQACALCVKLSFILINRDRYVFLCLPIVSGLMLLEDVSSVKVSLHLLLAIDAYLFQNYPTVRWWTKKITHYVLYAFLASLLI